MGVSKYNSEGYYDPTAYEALTKVAQRKRRRDTGRWCISAPRTPGTRRAIPKKQGGTAGLPQTPAQSPLRRICCSRSSYRKKRNGSWRFLWIWCCWVSVSSSGCSAARVSDGMRREIGKAKQKNMTIRYFTEGYGGNGMQMTIYGAATVGSGQTACIRIPWTVTDTDTHAAGGGFRPCVCGI